MEMLSPIGCSPSSDGIGAATALPRKQAEAPALSLSQVIYRDYRRYIATEETFFRTVFCSPGFWATCTYRVVRAVLFWLPAGFLRRFARIGATLVQRFMEIITVGISIPPECEIGEGLYIGHHGTSILPAHGRIGRNCNLAHSITIGLGGPKGRRGAPEIGNRVFIATHAVIAGKISIGDDAMICAGTVVTRSIPPRAVVVGNPGRVVSYDGSFDHVAYDGMDDDPERQASLVLRGKPDPLDSPAPVPERS